MRAVDGDSARDRVLGAAAELFAERGFQAVGIDLIIERAGVAKATLYHHFATKADLIAAYLDDADGRFWSWFEAGLGDAAEPQEALVGLFDAVAELVTSPVCLGCTFQVTAAEFPDPSHPGHRRAIAHKEAVRGRLRELAEDAGARDPDQLAGGLLLLMDGAFAAARMYGPDNPGRHVATAAQALLEAHLVDPSPGRRR